jgi:hypothetical protein
MPNLITKAVTVFKHCKAAGAPCQNNKKEEIVTKPLEGELGYISKSPLEVGVDLVSEESPGGVLAEFACTGVAHVRTFGSVIGHQLGDINTISKESELSFVIQEKEYFPGLVSKVNNPTKFEGAPEDILLTELEAEGSEKFEPPGGLPSGQEGVAKNKGEAIMVKA